MFLKTKALGEVKLSSDIISGLELQMIQILFKSVTTIFDQSHGHMDTPSRINYINKKYPRERTQFLPRYGLFFLPLHVLSTLGFEIVSWVFFSKSILITGVLFRG